MTPDIELDPMTVDDVEMDITVRKDGVRERDLAASLHNARAVPAGKPGEVVRYDFPLAEREAMRERGSDVADDEFQLDFPIKFARDLAARLPYNTKRLDQLRAAHEFIEQSRKEEVAKVSAELTKLGVDWSEPAANEAVAVGKELEVKVETDKAPPEVTAGEPMELRVTVKNNGKQPVYRLRAMTESDNGYFEGKELVFGKIAAGQSKTAKAQLGWCDYEGRKIGSSKPRDKNAKRVCKIPKDALNRSDGLKVKFEAFGPGGTGGPGSGPEPAPVEIRPTVTAIDRPVFQYSYQIADDRSGNGDGRLQKGEQATMYLTIKNAGKGRSFETQANIVNLSGEGLLLHAGRFDVSNMMPGDVRKVVFSFDVQQQLTEPEVTFALSVADSDLREVASEKVKLPIEPALAVQKASGAVKVGAQGATLLGSPSPGARGFGRLVAGASAPLLGTVGDLDKIDLGQGRFAFVAAREVTAGGSAGAAPAFDDVYLHAPPTLDVKAAAMATKGDKVKITGDASDTEKLLDIYIFVGSRKLYYKSNRDGADPKKASFEFDAPLRPGVNLITVVARENTDTISRRTIVVRKDGADGAILKTPKTDDPFNDGGSDDGDD